MPSEHIGYPEIPLLFYNEYSGQVFPITPKTEEVRPNE